MAAIGNSPTQQAFTPAIDYFSGNGSTTAFTLSRPVASVAQVQVTIDNVAQNPSSAYTVSSNTITFTSAPLSGTNNIYVYYTSPITQVIAPGQGTVTATSMVTGAVGITQLSATGTPSSSTYLRGDNSWAAIASSQWTTTGSNIYYNTGNVGVGTATPGYKIETTGSIFANGIEVGANTDSIKRAGDLYLITTGANSLYLRTNNTNALSINSSQQFGFAGNANGNFGSQSSFYNPGSNGWCAEFNTGVNGNVVMFQRTNSYPCTQIQFYGFNGAVATNAGSITHGGNTSTSYNTSSDYRMKENVQPMTSALSKVALLKPVTYKWKQEFGGKDGQGFIAHELQEIIPDCVTGEKDAIETYKDDEGNEQTRIKPQGIDTSFLVATLTAAIQELKALNDTQAATITALTARITALENK